MSTDAAASDASHADEVDSIIQQPDVEEPKSAFSVLLTCFGWVFVVCLLVPHLLLELLGESPRDPLHAASFSFLLRSAFLGAATLTGFLAPTEWKEEEEEGGVEVGEGFFSKMLEKIAQVVVPRQGFLLMGSIVTFILVIDLCLFVYWKPEWGEKFGFWTFVAGFVIDVFIWVLRVVHSKPLLANCADRAKWVLLFISFLVVFLFVKNSYPKSIHSCRAVTEALDHPVFDLREQLKALNKSLFRKLHDSRSNEWVCPHSLDVTVVMGPVHAGKTTLITEALKEVAARGAEVFCIRVLDGQDSNEWLRVMRAFLPSALRLPSPKEKNLTIEILLDKWNQNLEQRNAVAIMYIDEFHKLRDLGLLASLAQWAKSRTTMDRVCFGLILESSELSRLTSRSSWGVVLGQRVVEVGLLEKETVFEQMKTELPGLNWGDSQNGLFVDVWDEIGGLGHDWYEFWYSLSQAADPDTALEIARQQSEAKTDLLLKILREQVEKVALKCNADDPKRSMVHVILNHLVNAGGFNHSDLGRLWDDMECSIAGLLQIGAAKTTPKDSIIWADRNDHLRVAGTPALRALKRYLKEKESRLEEEVQERRSKLFLLEAQRLVRQSIFWEEARVGSDSELEACLFDWWKQEGRVNFGEEGQSEMKSLLFEMDKLRRKYRMRERAIDLNQLLEIADSKSDDDGDGSSCEEGTCLRSPKTDVSSENPDDVAG